LHGSGSIAAAGALNVPSTPLSAVSAKSKSFAASRRAPSGVNPMFRTGAEKRSVTRPGVDGELLSQARGTSWCRAR
jgi:hypothetical protein